MARTRALTREQHKQIAERSLLYFRLRIEAAKHSPTQLAKELGVNRRTINDYINRKLA